VGGPTERSLIPAPTVEEIVPQMPRQMPGTSDPQASAEESWPEPSATTGAEGLVTTEVEEEAPRKPSLLILPIYLALRP
jgi:hypothetical protein